MTGTGARGRRPGNPDTRAEILTAAWELFLRDGFTGTSLRAVAREAGCDAALVHHYFSSKEQLFFDALHVSLNIDSTIAFITANGPHGLGRRLFAALTAVYESRGADLLPLLGGNATVRELFVRFISGRIGTVAEQLVPGRAARRRLAAQAEAVIAGFVTSRYVLAGPHAAALTNEEAVAAYGDLLQAAIDRAVASRDLHS